MLASVWSSLLMVKVAAFGILVSSSKMTLSNTCARAKSSELCTARGYGEAEQGGQESSKRTKPRERKERKRLE